MRCMKRVIWGELWVGGFLSFHIAACLFTPVHPRHCPQDSAFLTPIPKPPYHCLASTPLIPNPRMCSVEGHRPRNTQETENHLCMYERLHSHTHTHSSSALHQLHAFVRNWDYDSLLCRTQRITVGDPGFADVWDLRMYCRLDTVIYIES